jgi:hypothetical protein
VTCLRACPPPDGDAVLRWLAHLLIAFDEALDWDVAPDPEPVG